MCYRGMCVYDWAVFQRRKVGGRHSMINLTERLEFMTVCQY